jgi:hypothetical protein
MDAAQVNSTCRWNSHFLPDQFRWSFSCIGMSIGPREVGLRMIDHAGGVEFLMEVLNARTNTYGTSVAPRNKKPVAREFHHENDAPSWPDWDCRGPVGGR